MKLYLIILSIETLLQQAHSVLDASKDDSLVFKFFPNTFIWLQSLAPLLGQLHNPSLGVMRPFAGAVFLVRQSSVDRAPRLSRDINGYSVALRMAIYSASLVSKHADRLPQDTLTEIIYLISITAELATDQLDVLTENKLFASTLDPDAVAGVREFASTGIQKCFSNIIPGAKEWREGFGAGNQNKFSAVVHGLVSKLVQASAGTTSIAFYSARVLSHLLSNLVEEHGWQNTAGEDWLSKLDILKTSTTNIFGAIAILTGLQDTLRTSKSVNNLCNRLISDAAGASAQSEKTLGMLVLLNSCLAVYDEDDLPVAQNRLVFAVKQILSWTESLATDNYLSSEVCRALQILLPAIKSVYGSYWETSLAFCVAIWKSSENASSLDRRLAVIGMSLKLFSNLQNLQDVNDDLEDALTKYGESLSEGLIALLKLPRPKITQPLDFVDDLLSRQVRKIPLSHIKDLEEFYPLVASDVLTIQSAAFDVLHRAIPAQQEQISLDVLLEKKGMLGIFYFSD